MLWLLVGTLINVVAMALMVVPKKPAKRRRLLAVGD